MANWLGYTVEPLPIGGAGRVRAVLDSVVDRAVVLVGATSATSWDAPGFTNIDMELQPDGDWRATFFGSIRGPAMASFFSLSGGVWEAGPTVAVPLDNTYESAFPWCKPWVVDRLKELASSSMPLGSEKDLNISTAFPRNIQDFPRITVQIDSVAPAGMPIGRITGGVKERGQLYNLNLSVVAWGHTPEDRDDISRWMGGALESVVDLLPLVGCQEPTFSIEEGEDFQNLEFPVFLVTARINTSAWSSLKMPDSHEYGRIFVS